MVDWQALSDEEVMSIATPIMDNLMQASTDVDHEAHVRDFSDRLKSIVTKENLEQQCREYQADIGLIGNRELVGIFRRKGDVRVFWKQWYSKTDDDFIAFLHLKEIEGDIKVVNVHTS